MGRGQGNGVILEALCTATVVATIVAATNAAGDDLGNRGTPLAYIANRRRTAAWLHRGTYRQSSYRQIMRVAIRRSSDITVLVRPVF